MPVARGNPRRPHALAPEHHRIVEIDQLRVVVEYEIGQRQRQPAVSQERREEPLASDRASCSTMVESGEADR